MKIQVIKHPNKESQDWVITMEDGEVKELVRQLCFLIAKGAKAPPVGEYEVEGDRVFIGILMGQIREEFGPKIPALNTVKEKLPILYEIIKMKKSLMGERDFHGLPEPTDEQIATAISRLLGGNDGRARWP